LRQVLVVSIDGWGTNLVGCYGNSLCATPNLNRFASQSIVFDRCWTTSQKLTNVLDSILGREHFSSGLPSSHGQALEAHDKKISRLFLTDDPIAATTLSVQAFEEIILIDPPLLEEPAEELNATRLAQVVQAVIAELAQRLEADQGLPDVVWLHLSGLSKGWDAPVDLRSLMCAPEEDPEPPTSVLPIVATMSDESDPDIIFGSQCVASAQAMVIDEVLGWLFDFLEESCETDDWLCGLVGTRGYPLGEHQIIGFENSTMNTELLHVPLIIRSGHTNLGQRESSLVQIDVLKAMMNAWLSHEPFHRSELSDWLDQQGASGVAFVSSATQIAVQTHRWSALVSRADARAIFSSQADPIGQLYLAPDDRWQQNNVASRAVEVAEAMQKLAVEWEKWIAEGRPTETRPELDVCLKAAIY
jgi:hypothetical protein